MSAAELPPLALYIHFPWCIKKCPYCDFLSYPSSANSDDCIAFYVEALLQDLRCDLDNLVLRGKSVRQRIISSIYVGGGTPTLLPLAALTKLMHGIRTMCVLNENAEITIEANPETIDRDYCIALRMQCGFNRISIGVQSFNDYYLTLLGRVHNAARSLSAVAAAHAAGFTNVNIDLMFGLPAQSIAAALEDLRRAVALSPTHLSWYQLTIEEGSAFDAQPPCDLPDDDRLWCMQRAGQELLAHAGYAQYEVSAYCKKGWECQHNLNYWQFGDYLGIGAGAHGKITHNLHIIRYAKTSDPQKYVAGIKEHSSFTHEKKVLSSAALPFEFMLNALRLYQPIPYQLFVARTGLPFTVIEERLQRATELGLIEPTCSDAILTTTKGRNFVNDLVEMFL